MALRSWAVATAAGLIGALGAASPAAAARAPVAPDVRETDADYRGGRALPLRARAVAPMTRARRRALRAAEAEAVAAAPPVGAVQSWPALDDQLDRIYLKPYTLRAVRDHIEVWVANALDFPAGDCRNGARTVVGDAQASYLADEFETTMYPKESAAFSVPPARDGSAALDVQGVPAGYWSGEGENVVALVDNVRDAHFYDTDNRSNLTYIAGFFYSVFNTVVDRNVMTIDAWDWLHRTGEVPPHEPSSDSCLNAPARPFLYESTFAHEYQHLLEYYEDPDEASWINEGISDWAQTLTGYVDPRLPVTDIDFDSHVQCFLGWLGLETDANPIPRLEGGPENSLTAWREQGDDEVLCDYGAAYTLMELLHGRYGTPFMTALHRGDASGLAGLAEALAAVGSTDTPASILRDWVATVALDGVLDRGARLVGRSAARLQTATLDGRVNWATPEAYAEPGAPPNGADFVRLRDAFGSVSARRLQSLSFDGAEGFDPRPVEWTVVAEPPEHPGDPALFSGSGASVDRSIVRQVTVPAGDPTLTFETRWDEEPGWDFAVVQVSTDGGRTYTSLANADTTAEHAPGAVPQVVAQLPGFTGSSGGWRTETFDLSAWAGQDVLLAFRVITDGLTDLAGWYVDDIAVGSTLLSDGRTVAGWQTQTQLQPEPVAGWSVQLVGYTSRTLDAETVPRPNPGVAFAFELPVGAGNTIDLDGAALQQLLRGVRRADVVAALVMQEDPTGIETRYVRYRLTVNGVRQPGG